MLQIAEGWTVHLQDEVSDALMERTNPSGPALGLFPAATGSKALRSRPLISMSLFCGSSAVFY